MALVVTLERWPEHRLYQVYHRIAVWARHPALSKKHDADKPICPLQHATLYCQKNVV
jgi:hypothetical protein